MLCTVIKEGRKRWVGRWKIEGKMMLFLLSEAIKREREREREREGRERENPEKGCKRSLSKVVVVAFGRGEGI